MPGDAFDVLAAATARFANLVRTIGATEYEVPIPYGKRTVAETARHVCEQYRGTVGLKAVGHRSDLHRTAAEIEELETKVEENFRPLFDQLGPSVLGAPAYLVGEAILHGDQIASTVGSTTWLATPADTKLYWRHGVGLLALNLRPEAQDVNETWELRFTDDAEPVAFAIASGSIVQDPDDDAPGDRHVLRIDDPVGFILGFVGRRSLPTPSKPRSPHDSPSPELPARRG